MFRKVTFVVGAGASAEFNLPVGSELKATIRTYVSFRKDETGEIVGGSDRIKSMYEHGVPLKCCQDIAKAMILAPSIDEFLNTRHDNEELVHLVV